MSSLHYAMEAIQAAPAAQLQQVLLDYAAIGSGYPLPAEAELGPLSDDDMVSLSWVPYWGEPSVYGAVILDEEILGAKAEEAYSLADPLDSWIDSLQAANGVLSPSELITQALVGSRIQQVLQPLRSLVSEDEDYDESFLEPSSDAVGTAEGLLLEAKGVLEDDMPSTIATTTGDGGVRIHFRHPSKRLRLVIPPGGNEGGYIYHCQGDDYGTVNDISVDGLVKWLRWLIADV